MYPFKHLYKCLVQCTLYTPISCTPQVSILILGWHAWSCGTDALHLVDVLHILYPSHNNLSTLLPILDLCLRTRQVSSNLILILGLRFSESKLVYLYWLCCPIL